MDKEGGKQHAMELKYPVGLISNNNAKRNKKGKIDLHRIVSILGGDKKCFLRETANLDELKNAIQEFKDKKIDIILSNGGDGTHQKLISFIINEFKGYKPYLVPLKSGTMNMLPKNLGLGASPYTTARWLRYFLNNKKVPNITIKHLLQIDAPELKEKKYGFVFIAGCGYKLLNLYYSYPQGGKRSAAKAILSSMTGWITRAPASKDIYTYTPSKINIDSKSTEFSYLITLASTLENLVLGFSPFALRKVDHDGFFVMIDGEPMWQNYNILKFFKVIDNEEWKSKRIVSKINNLGLMVSEGFSVDGELVNLDKPTFVKISKGPKIRFLTPRK